MGCLYCGKEIGPFRQIRDNEFCTALHRKKYGDRLGKALGQISAPEPPPAPIARFRVDFPVQQGNIRFHTAPHMAHPHAMQVVDSWPVSVGPALGSSFRVTRNAGSAAAPSTEFPVVSALHVPAVVRMPRFELAAMGGIQDVAATPAPRVPPMSEAWMPVAETQAAERWISLASAEPFVATLVAHNPRIAEVRTTGTFVRQVPTFTGLPEPEAAARPVHAAMDARPAASQRTPSMLRFAVHAVEQFETRQAPPEPTPAPAETFARLVPTAADCALAIATHIPDALSEFPAVRLPEIAATQTPAEPAPVPAEALTVPVPTAADCALAIAAHIPDALPGLSTVRLPEIAAPRTPAELTPAPAEAFAGLVPNPADCELGIPAHILDVLPGLAELRVPTMSALTARASAAPEIATSAELAQPLAGPLPTAAECARANAAHITGALPGFAALTLPSMAGLIAQVLPQARFVPGLQPIPVETLPQTAQRIYSASIASPALRLPSLSRFQPATDSSEALAASVAAPGPVPVESLPFAAARALLPLPVQPKLVARGFQSELRARFVVPAVAGPAPSVALPEAALARPAILEPMARIAAQPAGAQPERPVPAIPRPGPFQLEYHCQRITSAPSVRVEALEARIAITLPAIAIPAALGLPADLLRKKPSRIVLPFEEIFARQPQGTQPKRRSINTAGKIAAAVMVGLALWSGSRIANLSRHTEEFKADIAASERTVAVGEARGGADPTQGNFGKGPMGKVRRAIAQRAATEITDTFRGGMTAWGAPGAQSWAPGWKHNTQGYVSTGEMALFQPSLRYTDYRMEFYGQIEDKSLGWVVRAQDKKNYYAMKFTVIEPGLRPIIAMVHYGVVNGKPSHKVQTPLSVMVHNGRAMQVAVDVRGNRFTASVDGEPVDSWTDDTLAQGGVGFFSEPGERARLYWMKLSRNQDWLGRFCAYMSGDSRSKQQTAELWSPEYAHERPQPDPPHAPVMALALAVRQIHKQRRSEAWIS